jgi:hypothetical protein
MLTETRINFPGQRTAPSVLLTWSVKGGGLYILYCCQNKCRGGFTYKAQLQTCRVTPFIPLRSLSGGYLA